MMMLVSFFRSSTICPDCLTCMYCYEPVPLPLLGLRPDPLIRQVCGLDAAFRERSPRSASAGKLERKKRPARMRSSSDSPRAHLGQMGQRSTHTRPASQLWAAGWVKNEVVRAVRERWSTQEPPPGLACVLQRPCQLNSCLGQGMVKARERTGANRSAQATRQFPLVREGACVDRCD